MDIYQNKPRIKLTPTVRYGRKFIEAAFDDDSLRIPLSKEEGIQLVGGKAYLPEEHFVLAEFFDRYVKMAFIDYSSIRELGPGNRKTVVRLFRKVIWRNWSRCGIADILSGFIHPISGISSNISKVVTSGRSLPVR